MKTITPVIRKKRTFRNNAGIYNIIQLFVVFFILSACDSNNPESIHHSNKFDSTIYTTTTDSSFIDSLQLINHIYVSDEGELKIRIDYPEIKGLKDTALQSKINARLNEVFMSSAKADDDDLEGEGEIKTTYTVHFNSKGILSIAYSTWEFYSEASHAWTNYYSLNINLKNGKDILPEDLFTTNYKEKISSLLQSQEDALNKSGTLFTAANKEELPVYCLAKNGLVFYVRGSSEAEGTQEFKIPFDSLASTIHPSFQGAFY